MSELKAGIVGARGHAGGELLRLLDGHPNMRVVFAGSRELAGRQVPQINDLQFENLTPSEISDLDLDVLFLALPDGLSEPFVEPHDLRTAIVDISADHRFDDSWVYGIPELFREKISGARRIANPGCYATATQLAIAPFVDDLDGVPAAFGVSGYSGAGTTPSPKNDPLRLEDNLMPYMLVGHNHEKESTRYLAHQVRFMPHVHPAFRGLLVTVHIPVATEITTEQARERVRLAYTDEALVDYKDDPPELKDGSGINGVIIGGVEVSGDGHNVVVVAAEDNLLKGAAVQALQNMNLALDLPELAGLD